MKSLSAIGKWAVNLPMILRLMGQLLLVEAAFLALPLLLALLRQENDWKAFAIGFGLMVVVGGALNYLVRPKNHVLGRRDGLLLAATAWVVFSLFGMVPFLFSDTPLNASEAFLRQCRDLPPLALRLLKMWKRCLEASCSGAL